MNNLFQEIINLNESLKPGDFVHVGLKTKGGLGIKGKIEKIEGDFIYIRNENDKLYRGLIKNTTKLKPKDFMPTKLEHPELVSKLTNRKFSFSESDKTKVSNIISIAKNIFENKKIFEGSEQLNLVHKLLLQKIENLKNINEETKKEDNLKGTNKMKTFADFINTLDWKYDPEWLRSRQKGVEVKHTDRYVIVRDKDKGITRVTRKYNPETGLSDDPSDEIKVQSQDSEGQAQTQPVKRGRGRPPGKYGTYKSYNKTGKYVGVHAARKQKAQEAFEYIMNLDSEEEIKKFMTNLDEDTFTELYNYLVELEELENSEEIQNNKEE